MSNNVRDALTELAELVQEPRGLAEKTALSEFQQAMNRFLHSQGAAPDAVSETARRYALAYLVTHEGDIGAMVHFLLGYLAAEAEHVRQQASL